MRNFYPRPPRGGRHKLVKFTGTGDLFLSTPSARRATQAAARVVVAVEISIHALREEGDLDSLIYQCDEDVFLSTPSARRATRRPCGRVPRKPYFYPRPPRGGRPSRTTTPSFSERFLSTPSARRATVYFASCARQDANFYPRPPRGGRRPTPRALPGKVEFLSTPSARRATWCGGCDITPMTISIHALREEGDGVRDRGLRPLRDFYPRPPRGGRPAQPRATAARGAISIHALREEGDPAQKAPDRPGEISIHALREEGDPSRLERGNLRKHFYPRPPRGGRPGGQLEDKPPARFLSTPSARRATMIPRMVILAHCISIHALREEGDHSVSRFFAVNRVFLSTPSARRATAVLTANGIATAISIHALREEGDILRPPPAPGRINFYPRPPRGGRRQRNLISAAGTKFLSTPSARRATAQNRPSGHDRPISIHALREEGDPESIGWLGA